MGIGYWVLGIGNWVLGRVYFYPLVVKFFHGDCLLPPVSCLAASCLAASCLLSCSLLP
ncbi:MAG: hypothetical protein F6K47_33265 [Symploca sp. SIO2E6]|nr:hypothetical protein [Symploca sp. SIO2E6]